MLVERQAFFIYTDFSCLHEEISVNKILNLAISKIKHLIIIDELPHQDGRLKKDAIPLYILSTHVNKKKMLGIKKVYLLPFAKGKLF